MTAVKRIERVHAQRAAAAATYDDALAVLDALPAALATTRARLGLTIDQAAEQIGCPRSSYGRWEHGDVPPAHRYLAGLLRWVRDHRAGGAA